VNEIKSFTLYNEIFRLIDTIKPTLKRNEFLGQLMDFYFKDIKPKFEPNSYEETIWLNVSKPIISYKTKVINGSKGGRPKKTEIETKIESKSESESKTTSDVFVNVNVNNNLNIYEYIESNFGRTLNSIEYEEISKWEDNELTRYAVKEAVLNNAYSVKYVLAILQNWKNNNIKTVAQAQKQNKKRKGDIPEWFYEKIVGEKLEESERKEMEELLNQYS